jgi:hypothetical protein
MMSKLLKRTGSCKERKMKTTKSHMRKQNNRKAQNIKSSGMRYGILDSVKNKIFYWATCGGKEFMFVLVGRQITKNLLVIIDAFLMHDQDVSSAHVDVSPKGLMDTIEEVKKAYDLNGRFRLVGWGHSHAENDVFLSTVDTQESRNWIDHLSLVKGNIKTVFFRVADKIRFSSTHEENENNQPRLIFRANNTVELQNIDVSIPSSTRVFVEGYESTCLAMVVNRQLDTYYVEYQKTVIPNFAVESIADRQVEIFENEEEILKIAGTSQFRDEFLSYNKKLDLFSLKKQFGQRVKTSYGYGFSGTGSNSYYSGYVDNYKNASHYDKHADKSTRSFDDSDSGFRGCKLLSPSNEKNLIDSEDSHVE